MYRRNPNPGTTISKQHQYRQKPLKENKWSRTGVWFHPICQCFQIICGKDIKIPTSYRLVLQHLGSNFCSFLIASELANKLINPCSRIDQAVVRPLSCNMISRGLTTLLRHDFLLKISNRYHQLPALQLTGEVFVVA